MRNIRTWQAAGTAVIATLALALPAAAAPPGLVAAWDLDTVGSDLRTPDSSGNGLNADQWADPTPVAGHRGGAFRFTDFRDAFTAPFSVLTQTPTITVTAWVRSATVPPTVKTVVAHGADGTCNNASYAIYTGGSAGPSGLRFYIWDGIAARISPAAPNSVWDGTWHHVAGTYDGATVRFYVDGAQVGTGTPASGSIVYGLAASTRFTIGNYAGNLPPSPECGVNTALGGDIDEVRIFNRALNTTELDAVITGIDPAQPPTGGGGAAPVDDRDGDGIPDASDRCPGTADPLQADGDRDGIGDACEVLPSGALAPVSGRRVATSLVDGEVLVRLTPTSAPVPLAGVASLPIGAIVDARKGRIDLRTAGRRGRSQSARIAAGIFQIKQRRARRGRAAATDLVLRTPPGFARACAAASAPPKGVVRRLTVAAKGVFRTVGAAAPAKGSSGASWAIADRCDGTLTRAIRGRVSVRAGGRTVVVRPSRSYLVRARLFGAKVRRQGGR